MTTEAFTIPDTSPILSYFPYRDGSPTGGWEATFASKGDGSDQTLHLTQAANASVSFSVQATSLTVQSPYSSTCSSTISINGTTPVPACAPNNVFYTLSSLPIGTHKVVWSAGSGAANGSGVQFWGVQGVRDVPNESATIMIDDSLANYLSLMASNVPANDVASVPSITYNQSSTWSSIVQTAQGNDVGGPDLSAVSSEENIVSSGFYYNNSVSFTEAAGDTVTFKFQGYSIGIYGAVGPDHGSLDVSVNDNVAVSSVNLTTPWRLYNQLLFQQSHFDPSITTTVQLANDQNNLRMTLDYAVIRVPQFTADLFATSSSNSNKGFLSTTIGKIVVCGVIPFVAVLLLLFALWYWRRSRNTQSRKSHKSLRSEVTNASSAFWDTSAEKAKKQGAAALAKLWPAGHAPQSASADLSPQSGTELIRGYSDVGLKEAHKRSSGHALSRSISDRSGILPYRTRSQASSTSPTEHLAASLAGMDPSTGSSTSQSLMELLRAALAFQSAAATSAELPDTALPTYVASTQGSPSSTTPLHHFDILNKPALVSPSTSSQFRRSAATAHGAPSILSMLGQSPGSVPTSPPVVPPWPAHMVDSSPSAPSRSLASAEQDFPRPASGEYEIPIRMGAYSTAPSSTLMRRNSGGNDTDIMPSDSVSSVGSPHLAKRGWLFETSYDPRALSDLGIPFKPFVAGSAIASSEALSRYTSATSPTDPFSDNEILSPTSPLRPLHPRVPPPTSTTSRSAPEVSSPQSQKPEGSSSVPQV